ncbi:SnoaL-like domain-containing protein [Fusarium sp. LHS14.1]|nr:SnoaL-like domain-containing protein [Fusarium sp. LHS14.1]
MDKNGFVKDDAAYSDASKALTFLHMPPTKYHNPSLTKEEQEDFANGMNGARRFYDFEDMLSYDMFGNTIRGSFKEHFESIFPYWNDGHMEYKDFEVTALSKEYAFSTMIQHTWGTAGGVPFDTAFKRTGIARKNSQGEWKWIHEHLSFPTDMKTKQADFTASLDPVKATKLA